MQKILTPLFMTSLVLVLVNCTPKIRPTTTTKDVPMDERKTVSAKKFEDMSIDEKRMSITTLSDQQYTAGYNTYQAKCGKCHELPKPNSKDMSAWMKTMEVMSVKAKLSDEEYQNVTGYLYNNHNK